MRELTVLKRELSRGERGRGKRYSMDLRKRAVAWAEGRHQAGVSWPEISRELGLGRDTARRWCGGQRKATKHNRSLLPVKVVQKSADNGRLALVSPNGFRIEGLTLAEAATMLRALG